jgi:transcription initiation factor TFIIB
VSRKEIGRTYRFIARELKLKLMPPSPIDYIPRVCSELKLSGEIQAKAVEILKQAAEDAAGVREVADVAGVTEVTIRNRYKVLAEKLDIDIIL